ncbi:hypothetical protein [Pseudonocardia sp. N23]|uniref:hypothetical protein n=1 Tax=Pseudonocardia sp. N23 TaxID=1987376 RepID=UPI000BFCF696|nr:hypothetical protein [Pseudonocardia sp. N23]GAY12028.1 hypothetical protein TOK_0418 [Pseudonocardia sp. N23]
MGRIGETTSEASEAQRTEGRLRELDRKAMRAQRAAAGGARGVVAGGLVVKTSGSATTSGTTPATGAAILSAAVTMPYGRTFEVRVPNLGFTSVSPGFVIAQITHTLDGSAPTASSTVLDTGTSDTSGSGRGLNMVGWVSLARPVGVDDSAIDVPLKVLVTFWAGLAGTYTAQAAPTWPAKLVIEDKGPALVVA